MTNYEHINVFLTGLNAVLAVALIIAISSRGSSRKPAAAPDEESGASETVFSDALVSAMEDDFRRGGF